MKQLRIRKWAAAVASTAVFLTPALAGSPGENIFPIGNGSAWTYEGKAGTQPLNMTATITSSTKSGGKTTTVFRWALNGQPMQDETYIVTESGVARAKSGAYGSNKLTPPIPVIKYPMTVGKTWNWSGQIDMAGQMKLPSTATLKVSKRETVKSAAGTFNAYRVDVEITVTAQGQTQTTPATYWFAPGGGLVRQSAVIPTPNGKITMDATATKITLK